MTKARIESWKVEVGGWTVRWSDGTIERGDRGTRVGRGVRTRR